jgi:hypothetical protein
LSAISVLIVLASFLAIPLTLALSPQRRGKLHGQAVVSRESEILYSQYVMREIFVKAACPVIRRAESAKTISLEQFFSV